MAQTVQIRVACEGDAASIRRLAIDNAMFAADEMSGFDETMSGFFAGSLKGHRWLVATNERDEVVGGAYYAPEPFADRVWNLYFLAVEPGGHRSGSGAALIGHVEQELRHLGPTVARVLIVETSSLDAYAQARSFYVKQGFDEEARIREFYGPGDDKVVFWKALYR